LFDVVNANVKIAAKTAKDREEKNLKKAATDEHGKKQKLRRKNINLYKS